MPDIDDLQNKYDELTRTITRQNELRNSGSDDYDMDALDQAFRQRRHVGRAIEEAGGTPGGDVPQGDSPQSGKGGSTGSPPAQPTPPDPGDSTIGQLDDQIKQLRSNPPHPGVRLEGGKVIGGTAEDFKKQVEWRGRVERLEHELTAAQADDAWAQSGGPDGFTEAEIAAIKRAGKKIDGIQERLDAVNKKIAALNKQLDAARGQLDSQTTQGGGPNAASAAAIAVGARINADLRPLYKQQAAIMQEVAVAQEALAAIVRARVRAQLDASNIKVGLPNDKVGTAAVEDAFLRRVYKRLGLKYRAIGASGILRGLTGAQSALPSKRTGLLVFAAIIALLAFLSLAFLVLGGGDSTSPAVAVADAPAVAPADDTLDVVGDTPTEDPGVADSDTEVVVADPEAIPPPTATAIGIPYGCATVFHSPLDGHPESLSYFLLALLAGGLLGPIPDGTVLTVDAGGVSPNSAPIIDHMAEVPIPINRFGTYSIESVTAEGPDGPIPVAAAVNDIVVGGSEGPVDGCVTPSEALDVVPDWLFPTSNGAVAVNLWFGDEPPAPDFQAFLDFLDGAHETGSIPALLESLDAATLDRYGPDQCVPYLEQVVGTFVDPTLLDAIEEPWDYITDGATTNVPDAWTLQIDVTLGGNQVQVPMHVRLVGDEILWFTDCGEPVG